MVARVPIEPSGVAEARAEIARVARRAGLAPDRVDDLVVASSEAVTNAIEAQVRARITSPVEVRCRLTPTVVEVEIIDCGDGFEETDVHVRPPLHDPGHLDRERGWGVQLMRELTDELEFDLSGTGTTVRLRMVR